MNCNPFTLGHRSLVEYAVNNCDEVIIFAVQEDRSIFPFSDRFSLMKQGVQDMRSVQIVSGGDYIISMPRFPPISSKGRRSWRRRRSSMPPYSPRALRRR